jgi:hypothetical protein
MDKRRKGKHDRALRRAICIKAAQVRTDRMKATFVERFWARVKKRGPTDCWPWLRGKNQCGYGEMMWERKPWLSHRIAYTLKVGPIPSGLWVLHRCDNPGCCNPAHLWIGTAQDNSRDRENKGRGANRKGEKHPLAKLTASDVVKIRKLAANRIPRATIAERFGIHRMYVQLIVSKRRWKHIK